MTTSRLTKQASDDQRYQRLWAAITDNAKRIALAENKLPPNQTIAARDLGIDPAGVSRILAGKDLPQNQELLLRMARFYRASDSQIRALLALASALSAERRGEAELAKLYRAQFLPLFEEDAFVEEINTPRNIAFHAMLEIGVTRDEAITIAEAIDESNRDVAAAIGTIAMKLATGTTPMSGPALARIGDLIAFGKVFQQIVAIDMDVPWGGPLSRVVRHQLRDQAFLRLGSWTRIPNIAFTSFQLAANKTITDRKHSGFEFVFLVGGSGSFEMKSVGEVKMNPAGRYIVAYRPRHSHSFIAGAKGASLFVVSYLRSGEEMRDPIDELLRAAENPRRTVLPKRQPRTSQKL